MKTLVDRLETFVVCYPVVGQFRFFEQVPVQALGAAASPPPPSRATVLVKITDQTGNIGWGQSVPSPRWSYETVESALTTIDRYLAPRLIGQDASDINTCQQIMDRAIAGSFSRGQPICKAGVELALFDLTQRNLGQSVARRLGCQPSERGSERITLSWTLNPHSLDEVPTLVTQARTAGYRHFNIKVAPDPHFDLELCRQVRELAPDAFIWIDANGGYDLDTALAVASKMADLGVAAFEQPLAPNRLGGFRRLRQLGALPILMDEPIVSVVELEEFHQLGLLDGVAVKVSRCGGLTEAGKVIEYLRANDLLFFASGLTDPDLSLAASLALFAAHDLEHPAALNGPQFLSGSILSRPIEVVGDQATVPTGIGLGVEVDESAVDRLRDRETERLNP